mgnify:CR=1 FL=1
MSEYEQQKKQQTQYTESNNLEAHIIADMLRIESITTEVREFKQDTKLRLNKIENWLVAIVGTTFTTMVAILVGLLLNMFGGL